MNPLSIAKVLGSVALKNSDVGKLAVDVYNQVTAKEEKAAKASYEWSGNDLAKAVEGLPPATQKLFLEHQFDIKEKELENEATRIQARRDTKIAMEETDRKGGVRPKIAMIMTAVVVGLIVVLAVLYLTASQTGMKSEDVEGLNAVISQILKILEAFFSP